MGLTLDEAFAQAKNLPGRVWANITLVTNQGNGIVSYSQGALDFHPSTHHLPDPPNERFDTGGNFLPYLFSDRTFKVGEVPEGAFDVRKDQPFSIQAPDKLGLSLAYQIGKARARFTLANWGNTHFDVYLQPMAGVLYGEGSPIGNGATTALYVIAITGLGNENIR
jgi:hypothetical protein